MREPQGARRLMAVYVDSMRAQFGRMIMCHMIATTDEELQTMADAIGVARKWFQGNHYDIALSKRSLAVSKGAIEITWRQASAMTAQKRQTGVMGTPDEALVWFANRRKVALPDG